MLKTGKPIQEVYSMGFAVFFAVLLAIIALVAASSLVLEVTATIKDIRFDVALKVSLYKKFVLFSWNLADGGLSFLTQKKPVKEKGQLEKRLGLLLDLGFMRTRFHYLRRHIRFTLLNVKGKVASHDAAFTAILYGTVWQLLGALLVLGTPKQKNIEFYPDFKEKKMDLSVHCIFKVRLLHIIYLILKHQQKKIPQKGTGENYGTASN